MTLPAPPVALRHADTVLGRVARWQEPRKGERVLVEDVLTGGWVGFACTGLHRWYGTSLAGDPVPNLIAADVVVELGDRAEVPGAVCPDSEVVFHLDGKLIGRGTPNNEPRTGDLISWDHPRALRRFRVTGVDRWYALVSFHDDGSTAVYRLAATTCHLVEGLVE